MYNGGRNESQEEISADGFTWVLLFGVALSLRYIYFIARYALRGGMQGVIQAVIRVQRQPIRAAGLMVCRISWSYSMVLEAHIMTRPVSHLYQLGWTILEAYIL